MAVDGKEMHPVMVTTDLHLLILAAVVDGESRHAAQERLAPWQQDLHAVSFGDGHAIGQADRDWFEIKAVAGSSIRRPDEQRGERGSEPASKHVATLQAPRDKIAKTRVSSLKTRWLIAAVAGNNLDGLAHLGTHKMEGQKITAAL
jgi:hypothetical protein